MFSLHCAFSLQVSFLAPAQLQLQAPSFSPNLNPHTNPYTWSCSPASACTRKFLWPRSPCSLHFPETATLYPQASCSSWLSPSLNHRLSPHPTPDSMPSLKLRPSACANSYVFLQPIYLCRSAFLPAKAFKLPSSWSSGLPLFPSTDSTTHISFMSKPGPPSRIVLFQSIDKIGVFCYNMTLSVHVAD